MKPVSKRLTALCLTLVLAMGLLSGCAKSQHEEPSRPETSSSQSAPETAPEAVPAPEGTEQENTPEVSTGSEENVEKPEEKPEQKPGKKPAKEPAKEPSADKPVPAPQPQAPAEKPAPTPKPEAETPAPKPQPEPPKPKPQPPEEKPQDGQITVTMTIRCDDILNHLEDLTPGKEALVPKNGVIYTGSGLKYKEGTTVFELLLKETRKHGIHRDFETSQIYDSAYVKGIGNLYEFDCGRFSGWMYKVNGKTPNYGCSKYVLKDGDVVEWFYTCDGSKSFS